MAMETKKYILEIGLVFFIIIVLIPLMIILANQICIEDLFSENTGLYFYSTIVQANAAIFSILAIFYIFRRQYIDDRISSIREELTRINNAIATKTREYFYLSSEKRKEFIKSNKGALDILDLYKNADYFLDSKYALNSRMKLPLFLLISVIIIQSILLLLASGVHSAEYLVELSFFIFTLIIEIWALLIIIKKISLIVGDR